MLQYFRGCALAAAAAIMLAAGAAAQHRETLNRGFVGVKADSKVYLSWRLLATDADDISFDVFSNGTLLNTDGHLTTTTFFTDPKGSRSNTYVLKAYDGDDTMIEVDTLVEVYARNLEIALETPSCVDGLGGVYSPNDITVGDVDGDGAYELLLKWDPSNAKDNSQKGRTSRVYIDCYKLTGERLWRIDLGPNIRAGAHYTQMACYDFDGNGKAELMVKTAPGSTDGNGTFVSEAATIDAIRNVDNAGKHWNSDGYVLSGQEWLTVFEGETGAALHTVPYKPQRNLQYQDGASSYGSWGDSYGNRGDRYLCGVAHLDDGIGASAIFVRGYYTAAFVWAVDFDGERLSTRWIHESRNTTQYSVIDSEGGKQTFTAPAPTARASGSRTLYGNGNHNMSIADVDADGCDEIIWGSAALDHDGKLLYSTGLGHGDAIHLGDFDPTRPGLELFTPHEEKMPAAYGCYDLHDAATGEILAMGGPANTDNGRGMCAQLSPNHYEAWFSSSADRYQRSCMTGAIASSAQGSTNGRIYWDGDLQDELLDGNVIAHFNGSGFDNTSLTGNTCNGTKKTPCFSGDIFGDWREELILWSGGAGSHKLLIYTTTIPTKYRVTTLAHDHTYRMGMAWENSCYNQPPHIGFFLPDLFGRMAAFVRIEGSGMVTQEYMPGIGAFKPITYRLLNATGAEIVGELPAGLTFSFEEGVMTIDGNIVEPGRYEFQVTTVGMDEGMPAATLRCAVTVSAPETNQFLARYNFDGSLLNSISNANAEAKDCAASFVEGVEGQALALTGSPTTAGIVEHPYSLMELGVKNFTLSLWMKSTMASSTNAYLLHTGSHTRNAATGASGKWLGVEYKNGNIYFAVDDDDAKSVATLSGASTSLFDGRWHQLTCVRDHYNGKMLVYADGVLKTTADDVTGDISHNEDIVIGNCNVLFNTPYVGLLDKLEIWEGVKGDAEILAAYSESKPSALTVPTVESWTHIENDDTGLTIAFRTMAQRVNVEVYDLGGVCLISNSYLGGGRGSVAVGEYASLPEGLYMVRVKADDIEGEWKVVKK